MSHGAQEQKRLVREWQSGESIRTGAWKHMPQAAVEESRGLKAQSRANSVKPGWRSFIFQHHMAEAKMQVETKIEQLERTRVGTYVFEHEGMSIHDPLSSECGRFRYDPEAETGHSPAEYGFEVESYESGGSAWVRHFKVGEVEVVMHLTDESASTHKVPLGQKVRFEVSRVEDGEAGQPLAVWYQAEGALDDTPPRVVFKGPDDLSTGKGAGEELSCPNCGRKIAAGDADGCGLHMLIQTLRERGTKSEGRLLELHARCDAAAMWTRLAKVADDAIGQWQG